MNKETLIERERDGFTVMAVVVLLAPGTTARDVESQINAHGQLLSLAVGRVSVDDGFSSMTKLRR